MAGIGFRLQKLLAGESYTDLVRAYFYSTLITAGPLLVVMLALVVIKTVTQFRLSLEERNLVMGLIVYIYAISMVGVGPFVYVVTRYLADKVFLKQMDVLTPTFLSVIKIVFLGQSLFMIPFLFYFPFSPSLRWTLWCLDLSVSGIWIAMIFLSAARSFAWIGMAYNIGALVGIGWAYLLSFREAGLSSFLVSFTLGQAVIFFILTFRVFREFGFRGYNDFGFLLYFKRHPYLILIGFFYNLGIWVDKFQFWFSPQGEDIGKGLRVFLNYDTPMFLAFLTVVPSLAFFLVQMETSFMRKYQAYYESVRQRESLALIRENLKSMSDNLASHFQKFVLFQGFLSSLTILFVYTLADVFYLNPLQVGIFRIGIVGSFLFIGYVMILNILFYFDFQKEIFWVVFVFFILNVIFTYGSLLLGLPAYGFGYTIASFGTLLFGFAILNSRLKHLNYWTFMKQPVLVPKFQFESESRLDGSEDFL